MSDLKFNNSKGYYDIFASNGELAMDNSFETSLLLSILTDSKADESSITNPLNRRGNFLDIIIEELGSDKWVELSQAKTENINLDLCNKKIYNAISWLEENSFVSNLTVKTRIENKKLIVDINYFENSQEFFKTYEI